MLLSLFERVVIILDNSSDALIVPSLLADIINPIADQNEKSIKINLVKVVRFFCFF